MSSQKVTAILSDQRLMINPNVSFFHTNNEYMIFNNVTRKYYRIGESAYQLIELLKKGNKTGDDLIEWFCYDHALNRPKVNEHLRKFIVQMVNQGMIIYENSELNAAADHYTSSDKKDKGRFRLKMGTDKVNKVFSSVKVISREIELSTFIILGVLSTSLLAFIIYAIFSESPNYNVSQSLKYPFFLYIIPWVLLHLALHELSHAYTCKKAGGEVREIGIGLLYYVLPVAYVDLTDTYRLDNKLRSIVSLAGPLFDLIALTITATVVLMQDGNIQTIAYAVMSIQLFIFILNCNLFLPSDLYRSIESFSKDMNLRKHSFEYMKSILFNKKRPIYIKKLSYKREILYVSYSIVSTLYITVFVTTFVLLYIMQITTFL